MIFFLLRMNGTMKQLNKSNRNFQRSRRGEQKSRLAMITRYPTILIMKIYVYSTANCSSAYSFMFNIIKFYEDFSSNLIRVTR